MYTLKYFIPTISSMLSTLFYLLHFSVNASDDSVADYLPDEVNNIIYSIMLDDAAPFLDDAKFPLRKIPIGGDLRIEAASFDKRLFAQCSDEDDRVINIIELKSKQIIQKLRAWRKKPFLDGVTGEDLFCGIVQTVFSPNGSIIASIQSSFIDFSESLDYSNNESMEYQLKIWDVKSGKKLRDFFGVRPPIAFNNDQTKVATGEYNLCNGVICVWDIKSGHCLTLRAPHQRKGAKYLYPTVIMFNSSTDVVIAALSDNSVVCWDLNGKSGGEISHKHDAVINSLAITPDNVVLASGAKNGIVTLLNSEGPGDDITIQTFNVSKLTFSTDGNMIAAASDAKNATIVEVWGTYDGKKIKSIDSGRDSLVDMSFSKDQKQLYLVKGNTLEHWALCPKIQNWLKDISLLEASLINTAHKGKVSGKFVEINHGSLYYTILMGINDRDIRYFLVGTFSIRLNSPSFKQPKGPKSEPCTIS